MATAATQLPTTHSFGTAPSAPEVKIARAELSNGPKDVHTEFHYFKDNEDGSPPHPTYTDRPETYEREHLTYPAIVHDVRGREAEFTLDKDGFEFVRRPVQEKDFLDDEVIKAGYYPEVEQLLKDV